MSLKEAGAVAVVGRVVDGMSQVQHDFDQRDQDDDGSEGQ